MYFLKFYWNTCGEDVKRASTPISRDVWNLEQFGNLPYIEEPMEEDINVPQGNQA